MPAPPPPSVIRRAAAMAVKDARAAWKAAADTPDEEHTRAAFRHCVLADRMVRRAAGTLPEGPDRRRMVRDADRIAAAAAELEARLVHIIEGGPAPAKGPGLDQGLVRRLLGEIDRIRGQG